MRWLHAGFTLLEMLVTLIIVSVVAGVVWQALGHLYRVEALLTAGRFDAVEQSVRAEWVRSALTALLPGDTQRNEQLVGGPTELTGLSADVPAWPAPGIATLNLRLQYSAADDHTSLLLVQASKTGSSPGRETSILRWPGRTGRFRYLGQDGNWQDRWPPDGLQKASALPRAVMAETGLPDLPLLIASLPISPAPLPSRHLVEGL